VQRRQERQDEAQRADTTSAENGTPATPSPTVVRVAQLVKLQGEQPCADVVLTPWPPGPGGTLREKALVSGCRSLARYERFQAPGPALVRWRGVVYRGSPQHQRDHTGRAQYSRPACPTSGSWDHHTVRAHRPAAHGTRTRERPACPGSCGCPISGLRCSTFYAFPARGEGVSPLLATLGD
jgi:hypothetical protein